MRHDPNLTDASTVSNYTVSKTEVGMAHFAGTGPKSKKCRHCIECVKRARSTKHTCEKYERMTGDSKKAITGNAPACKYFTQRPPNAH